MPGCCAPPGTSRFKFPKNKKKKKLWLKSLKIDENNEIRDSRVCSLHFKPNLSPSAKLPEISPARKFLLKCISEQTRSSHDKKFEAKLLILFFVVVVYDGVMCILQSLFNPPKIRYFKDRVIQMFFVKFV